MNSSHLAALETLFATLKNKPVASVARFVARKKAIDRDRLYSILTTLATKMKRFACETFHTCQTLQQKHENISLYGMVCFEWQVWQVLLKTTNSYRKFLATDYAKLATQGGFLATHRVTSIKPVTGLRGEQCKTGMIFKEVL